MPAIAYLLNQYPAVSHTFIEREIRALRARGVEVETFSIHRSDPSHILAAADRREYEQTYALRPLSMRALLRAHVRALAAGPRNYLRSLAQALALGGSSIRDCIWQLFYFAEAAAIWSEMRSRGIRHIHAHFTTPAADVAMLTAALGDASRPWSWSFSAHGPDIQDVDQQRLKVKVESASAVVCVSDFGRSQLMVLTDDSHWNKLKVVHCGVDPEDFQAPGHRPRGDRSVQLLSVGRLVPYKGHELLLEAIAQVRDQGVDVALTIVGDGPLRESLQRASRRLQLDGRVVFAGNVGQDDIRAYYDEADIFCLASLREGVPVVLMEAMACRLPVITTQIMGIPELVEQDVSGLLVPPGRSEPLAAAILELSADPDRRARLAAAARSKVLAEFDVHDSAERLDQIFGQITGTEPDSTPSRAVFAPTPA